MSTRQIPTPIAFAQEPEDGCAHHGRTKLRRVTIHRQGVDEAQGAAELLVQVVPASAAKAVASARRPSTCPGSRSPRAVSSSAATASQASLDRPEGTARESGRLGATSRRRSRRRGRHRGPTTRWSAHPASACEWPRTGPCSFRPNSCPRRQAGRCPAARSAVRRTPGTGRGCLAAGCRAARRGHRTG